MSTGTMASTLEQAKRGTVPDAGLIAEARAALRERERNIVDASGVLAEQKLELAAKAAELEREHRERTEQLAVAEELFEARVRRLDAREAALSAKEAEVATAQNRANEMIHYYARGPG